MPSPARRYHLTETQARIAREFVRCPDDWRYGYELVRRTGIDSGTVYPILARWVQRHGWLEQRYASVAEGGPVRSFLRPSPQGLPVLTEMVRRWDARHEGRP